MGSLTEPGPGPESERTDGSILLYVCIWRPTSLRAARIRTKSQGPEFRRQSKKLRTQDDKIFLKWYELTLPSDMLFYLFIKKVNHISIPTRFNDLSYSKVIPVSGAEKSKMLLVLSSKRIISTQFKS